MTRVGKKPIPLPDKVKVNIQGSAVNVEGPLGKLSFALPPGVSIALKDNILQLSADESNAMFHGTARARVANMVQGVSASFKKVLEMQGLGFKAQVQGKVITMELGFSHPVLFDIPDGIKIEVDLSQQKASTPTVILAISGIDKELVGAVAARIRKMRPPEPYKGTGIRYQGEHVQRKAGKTAAGAK